MRRMIRSLAVVFPRGGFTPAYDPFAASIVHAYEPARRVLSTYTGNLVRLRRASDNAEADFGYLGNGDLDVAAIAAWAGGASYVVTVYDQKGGDNVTMAVAANQPLYVAAAQNGHAGMTLDGTNDYLQGAYTTGGALSQPVSMYAIAKTDTVVSGRYILDGDDAANRMALLFQADNTIAIFAGGIVSGAGQDTNFHVFAMLFSGAASALWQDGAAFAAGDAGLQNADGITVGARNNASTWLSGDITSVIVADPSHSDAQRAAMEIAMNTYWGVF